MKSKYEMPQKESTADSVLVGFDVQPNGTRVLIVGKKLPNKPVTVINAFEGNKAQEIWDLLAKNVEKDKI